MTTSAPLGELAGGGRGGRDAVEAYASWLRDELVPTRDGDFRLGPSCTRRSSATA